MQKSFSLLAAIAIGLTLAAGCNKNSGTATSSGAKHVIAVIPKGTTHVFWQSVKAGAEAAGKEFGYEIQWNGPEREGDRERQIQIVEDFIVQKVDGVVIAPLDKEALVPSVENLAAAKIPCAVIDSSIGTEKYLTFAATDNYQGGTLAARRMGEILGGKGNVLVLKYAPGSGSTTDREMVSSKRSKRNLPGSKSWTANTGRTRLRPHCKPPRIF